MAILLFTLALAPYDIAKVVGWARAAIVDWHHAPSMTHSPLKSLPMLALFVLRGNQPSRSAAYVMIMRSQISPPWTVLTAGCATHAVWPSRCLQRPAS